MDAYTNLTDEQLRSLAYDMTGGAQAADSAALELDRRERRDAAIDRETPRSTEQDTN